MGAWMLTKITSTRVKVEIWSSCSDIFLDSDLLMGLQCLFKRIFFTAEFFLGFENLLQYLYLGDKSAS